MSAFALSISKARGSVYRPMTVGEDSSQTPDPGAVLAIVPAHDEAGRVGQVVSALTTQGLPLLVVDDGSSDATGAEAAAAGARVLRLEPNRGKGAALKASFREGLGMTVETDASGTGWAAFLTLDGDGQHDPAEVPKFLEIWERTGVDLVVGMRDYRHMPPIRWFTNTVSRLLFSWALGRSIPDNQSGYRLHSRRLAEAALSSREDGFAFEVEEIAICLGRGYSLAWVPIKTIYGTETSDIRPWTHFSSFIRVTRHARKRMNEERRAQDR
ncbi:MAG: glycosyltransferase family 2 protein [Thermoleophilia bacterium]